MPYEKTTTTQATFRIVHITHTHTHLANMLSSVTTCGEDVYSLPVYKPLSCFAFERLTK